MRFPSMRLLAAFFSVAGVACAQTACLDQSYVPTATNGLEVTASQSVTQTFTVGLGGQLTRVEIALVNWHRGQPTQPLVVDLVATDASGVPTGAPLASVTLAPAMVPPTRGPLAIDLTPFGIQVLPGEIYGIALSSAAAPRGATYAWWGEAPSTAYPGGQVFIRGTTSLSSWDLAFRTWVAVPAGATSYGTGYAGTNGVPVLTASAAPVLGTSPTLGIGNSSPAATTGALFAGAQRANLPTPLGGTLLVDILASVTLAVPASGASVPMPVPNDPGLCGVVVDFQAVLLDAGARFGVAFTPGLEFVLGN